MKEEKKVENIIKAIGITKHFVNVIALDSVDFNLKKGEIHGLVGENGAGKSTLINVLCGVTQPDKGEISFNGNQIKSLNPIIANKLGISVIHQNIYLCPSLTVGENVFLSNIPRKRFFGFFSYVDWNKLYQESEEILNRVGFGNINVKAEMKKLNTGEKQAIQIARAISHNSSLNVLILDEPSAILNPAEVEYLFVILRKMKKEGISIIYISHYLNEVLEITNRLTVLRDGKHVATMKSEDVTKNELVFMMTGKKIDKSSSYIKRVVRNNEVLSVKSLKGKKFEDVNFSLNKGEILGIAGLIGSGKIGITRAIFGISQIISGEIYLNKRPVRIKTPEDAIRLNIGLVPENRQTEGLILCMKIRENATMAFYKQISHFGVIKIKKEKMLVQNVVDNLKIKTHNIDNLVNSLSGGNQQKVSFAKWLFSNNINILLLEEPTSGIDVGAKVKIYNIMEDFVKRGGAIILSSSEIPEILKISDKILVINKGKITGRFSRLDATEGKIMRCML